MMIALSSVIPLRNEVVRNITLPCTFSLSYNILNAVSDACSNINCTMFWYGTWNSAVLSSSSPGKKPISLVGTALLTRYTHSYGVDGSRTCSSARYNDTKVLPVPHHVGINSVLFRILQIQVFDCL